MSEIATLEIPKLQGKKFGAEAGIVSEGIAQVIDDLGNPATGLAIEAKCCSSLLIYLYGNSYPTIALANTYLTHDS